MAHDPELDAAAFLSGEHDDQQRAAFNAHLISCDECWAEVHAAQRGRQLAESARTVAPSELRERIRAIVDAEGTDSAADPRGQASRRLPVRRVLIAAAAAATVAVTAAVLTVTARPSTSAEPRALSAAVADYRAHELPGRRLPTTSAPDLTRLKLVPTGAGGGSYAGLPVDGYAYRDSAGRRLVLYLSQQPFPTAPGARRLEGPDGPWTVQRGDVVLLCARAPHALLVVGQDAQLIRDVANALGVL